MMKTKDRSSILVTGGAGYIGAHCCKALFEAGYKPISFDNLSTGNRGHVKWGPLIEGDIRDTETVHRALREHKVSAVMHLAALSLVGQSVVDPQIYYQNNLAGTLSLLDAMRSASCDLMVFSSTGAVYGNAGSCPIPESYQPRPINPYGTSKLMVEQVLSDYRTSYGLRSFCFRYFNASGADPSGEIGELRSLETHLIPRAMMAITSQAPDFRIFGTDYPTHDGSAVRDYIHVSDIADAHVIALERLIDGHQGDTFNLGTGVGISVKEVLTEISRESGIPVPFTLSARREGDPAILMADVRKAFDQLSFRPKNSDIATIIRTAWFWHSSNHMMAPSNHLRPVVRSGSKAR